MTASDSTARRPEDRLRERGGAVECLRPLGALYRGITGLRNAAYDAGLFATKRLEIPVVSVGNLSVGGTGKTPMVVWVARELIARGRKPGVLSRGYRAQGEQNDEGRLLERTLPGVPQVQNPDRIEGGEQLVAAGVDVIVLDDGFQHRRLGRDVDLVLVDATRPWGLPAPAGGGDPVRALLPRGFLREAPTGLARASAVVLTRCDQVEDARVGALETELERLAPGVPRARARHRATFVTTPEGVLPLGELAERDVVLVSGLGNPEAFERSARDAGAQVVATRRFPDHHHFRRAELERLAPPGAVILTSSKDAVKFETEGVPCWVLEVELELLSGNAVLEALLDSLRVSDAKRVRLA